MSRLGCLRHGAVRIPKALHSSGFSVGEDGMRHLQALRMLSVVRWLWRKMPPIFPPDSWKMSRMNQHRAVWVGNCVCTALSAVCFQGQSSLQEGQRVLGELKTSSEDRLLQPCQIGSPASVPVCKAGHWRWYGYIWDNESEISSAPAPPSALPELPWLD